MRRLAAWQSLSVRSLQRALGDRGTRFTTVLADVRRAHAARLLLKTRQSPDQAHFTREFKRRTALASAQFREKLEAVAPSQVQRTERDPFDSRRNQTSRTSKTHYGKSTKGISRSFSYRE